MGCAVSDQTFEEFHADCGPECECYAAKHPMTAPLPTPTEVEGMRERHVPEGFGVAYCGPCDTPWPCDPARLLALVEARMPSVEQVRHVLTSYGVDPFDGTYGVPQYDALVDDLVALRGGGE